MDQDGEAVTPATDPTAAFEAERGRLTAIAARVLGDDGEAEDVVQQAWLRRQGTTATVENDAAWLTTVVTRLCLDRLRARTPEPVEDDEFDGPDESAPEPGEAVAMADAVGAAVQVVLDRLAPRERVAFVLHDVFGFEFTTIAAVLDSTASAARKLASRARTKVTAPANDERTRDQEVVDAFMAAARGGDLERLLRLLAPDAVIGADTAAIAAGTPERIAGQEAVAAFFDGSAHSALPVAVDGRAAYAWYHRGEAKVVFDFTVVDGVVHGITFRADPAVLADVKRRPRPTDRPTHIEEDDR